MNLLFISNFSLLYITNSSAINTSVHFFWWMYTDSWVYLELLLSHLSRVRLCATPEMEAHQAPPSLEFSRQEHWSGLPFPSPMHESEKWSRSVVSNSSDPMDCSPPSSSVHGIFQAKVLEWGAIAFSVTSMSCYQINPCLLRRVGDRWSGRINSNMSLTSVIMPGICFWQNLCHASMLPDSESHMWETMTVSPSYAPSCSFANRSRSRSTRSMRSCSLVDHNPLSSIHTA